MTRSCSSLSSSPMSYRPYSVATEESSEFEGISSPSVVQALFHENQNFTISGGTFNFTVQRRETEFENFRRIRLGDIVLETKLQGVRYIHGRNVVRRVHTAKIVGIESPMTVAIYEGQEKGWKEKWDGYISLHMRLRHPNLSQLFGITSSHGLYAAIFHNEYIPCRQMRHMYSVTSTHESYFERFFRDEVMAWGLRIPGSGTYWFHPSGKLCFEMSPGPHETDTIMNPMQFGYPDTIDIPSPRYILPLGEVSKIIDSMTIESYYRGLIRVLQYRVIPLTRHSTVRPYSIVKHVAGHLEEMAFLPQDWHLRSSLKRWEHIDDSAPITDIMPTGWTRVLLCGDEILGASFQLELARGDQEQGTSWFSQANYSFDRVGLECSYVDQVHVFCEVTGSAPPSLHKIWLFLPPYQAFLSTDLTRYCFPDDEPYWSFDPSGKGHLSSNEAIALELPHCQLEISVYHTFVDEALLKDLHTFHTSKGFNPDSQEVAKYLGLPLFCFGDEGDPSPSPLIRSVIFSLKP
ncbi:hypothetical protein R3P38DRAFT_3112382 [Favolaschia claudopus]|uniref:Uncharacterized protein n=1 Tax=Favolaschia claudopus TaxID=2862362 RepID=A0AAV9ZHR4_9AGAR